jgi:hypothetical protein
LQKDLLGQWHGFLLALLLQSPRRLNRALFHARVLVAAFLGELLLRKPLGVALEHRSIGSAAGLQNRIVDLSCVRPIKLREERRVDRMRSPRSNGARPKAEPMQCQGCGLWIGSYDFCAYRCIGPK